MAQFNWTYLGDTGQPHVVGLYHGEKTGHLMVHCNSQVIVIDFHVLDSKSYTFFIEDELVEIKLERKGDRFFYHFIIDQQADTPRNRERKKTEKRHLRTGLLMISGLLLCALLFMFVMRYYNRTKIERMEATLLDRSSYETVARVSFASHRPGTDKVSYSFVANGRIYEGSSLRGDAMPPHGLPLEPGDEFMIRYAPQFPSVHEIDYERPSAEQIRRYRQRAFDRHAQLHPELDARRINCVLDVFYSVKGLDAYADVFFQHDSPASNPVHNSSSYRKLIGNKQVIGRLVDQCK